MKEAGGQVWKFKARFRRHAFGWKSQPAIGRLREAVSEITKVRRKDPVLAAEGAVSLLERLSPAIENVDSSSGAIGTAVNNAIAALVPIIGAAPADSRTRQRWLERLWQAFEDDRMPYLEALGDLWGEACSSKELASAWADRLIGLTRRALSADGHSRPFFQGTSACLSALYRAERYEEIVELVAPTDILWSYKRWAVRALAALDRKPEAIRYAEASRGPWASDRDIDALCEEILLSSGSVEEAYVSYGLSANRAGTYLATFRAVARKYPHKSAAQVLADLVGTTPGEEGKWFAAAKDAGLYDEALALAARSPCDPRTLTRAARDFAEREPAFAAEAGILALQWLTRGYGYEVTGIDVLAAYSATVAAGERSGTAAATRERLRALVAGEAPGGFVRGILAARLGL